MVPRGTQPSQQAHSNRASGRLKMHGRNSSLRTLLFICLICSTILNYNSRANCRQQPSQRPSAQLAVRLAWWNRCHVVGMGRSSLLWLVARPGPRLSSGRGEGAPPTREVSTRSPAALYASASAAAVPIAGHTAVVCSSNAPRMCGAAGEAAIATSTSCFFSVHSLLGSVSLRPTPHPTHAHPRTHRESLARRVHACRPHELRVRDFLSVATHAFNRNSAMPAWPITARTPQPLGCRAATAACITSNTAIRSSSKGWAIHTHTHTTNARPHRSVRGQPPARHAEDA